MGEVYRRAGAISAFPLLGEELVGIAGHPVYLRYLHHEEDQVAVVERRGGACEVDYVVGRRPRVRPCSRLLHQPVLFPELCDSFQFAGEVVVDG